MQAQNNIAVHYSVELPDDCAGSAAPDPITVNVKEGSTAIDVMIKAINIDVKYKFTATSFGEKMGYMINSINKIPAVLNLEEKPKYYWAFLIKDGAGPPQPATVGVSSYKITHPLSMILRYTSLSGSECPAEPSQS